MAVKWEKQYKFTWNICALNHCFLKFDTCAYQGLEMLVFRKILRTYLMDGPIFNPLNVVKDDLNNDPKFIQTCIAYRKLPDLSIWF